MAAIRHPKAKTTKGRTAAPKGAVDEVASLRTQLDAAVNDYRETIRLTKLYMAALHRNPPKPKKGERSAWDKIIEAGHSIPQEELDRHPTDGGRNLHHYLYGTPKQDPDQVEIAFADAAYYIGLLLPNDELHDSALRRKEELQDALVVTHDGVLVEVLAHVSQMGAFVRLKGVSLVQDVRADHRIQVIEQTRDLFDAGLALYAARLDKGYSLTDCMSMVVCRDLEVEQVLSHDHHFAQEGLAVLP